MHIIYNIDIHISEIVYTYFQLKPLYTLVVTALHSSVLPCLSQGEKNNIPRYILKPYVYLAELNILVRASGAELIESCPTLRTPQETI